MLKATLYLQKSDNTDDVVRIYETEDTGVFDVTYDPEDSSSRYTFTMGRAEVMKYVTDILRSLDHDADPFQYVQVSTPLHPSILYHTADFADRQLRHRVEDMIEAAILMPVKRTSKL